MSWYHVERKTTGREVYLVEASSPEEAEDIWFDGELCVSEVIDSEPYKVTLESE